MEKKNRSKQEKTTKFLYVDVALSEETCSWWYPKEFSENFQNAKVPKTSMQ